MVLVTTTVLLYSLKICKIFEKSLKKNRLTFRGKVAYVILGNTGEKIVEIMNQITQNLKKST